jgi:drug/metabolite transporter (DMT)-like permease
LRFSAREHGYLAALGVTLMGLNYVGIYWSELFVTSGLVAVLFSTIVFMNPIGMRLAFGTPLSGRTLIAAMLGVGGVSLLFLPEFDQATRGGSAGFGVALALGATVMACFGNLIAIRNHNAGIPTFPGTAWGMAYGALTAAIAAVARGVPWTFDASAAYLSSLAYLAFGVVAFGAYLTLLKPGRQSGRIRQYRHPVIALALDLLRRLPLDVGLRARRVAGGRGKLAGSAAGRRSYADARS